MEFKFKSKSGAEIVLNIKSSILLAILNLVSFSMFGSMEFIRIISSLQK